jgi:class 3 adenylate cyclase
MQEDLKRYAGKLRERGQPPLLVRVGVNSGEVVVRSIQTGDAHTEYTPIGHSVSLASRLQTLAAPGSVVIGESVRKFVEGYFQLKALGVRFEHPEAVGDRGLELVEQTRLACAGLGNDRDDLPEPAPRQPPLCDRGRGNATRGCDQTSGS